MKRAYEIFRFVVACAIIFYGGYRFGHPHFHGETGFFITYAGIGIYALWRMVYPWYFNRSVPH